MPFTPTITRAGTIGGLQKFTMVSASGLNTTLIHTRPCQLVAAQLGSIVATPRFLKLYDIASFTSGIAGNCDQNFIIPGNTAGAGSNFGGPAAMPVIGAQFDTGMVLQLSTAIGIATISGVEAGDCVVNLWTR